MLLCSAEKYSNKYLATNIKIKYRERFPQVYLFLKNKTFAFQFTVYKCFHDQHLIWGSSYSLHVTEMAAQRSLPRQDPDFISSFCLIRLYTKVAALYGGGESQKVQITVMSNDRLAYMGPHSSLENVIQCKSTYCAMGCPTEDTCLRERRKQAMSPSFTPARQVHPSERSLYFKA